MVFHRSLIMLCFALVFCACEPQDRRPGLWLSGEVQPVPEDLSFVNDHQEVLIETRPWYGVPHSVTVVIAEADGRVYVPSIYSEDVPFPGTKRWNANIAADPDVRLKVGDVLYEMTARPAATEAEWQAGFDALAAKYGFWAQAKADRAKRPPFAIIVLERG